MSDAQSHLDSCSVDVLAAQVRAGIWSLIEEDAKAGEVALDVLVGYAKRAEELVCGDECICERCGRDYPIWFVESEAWNLAVNRTQEYGDEWQFLCPTCFVRLHEIASGKVFAWKLTAE